MHRSRTLAVHSAIENMPRLEDRLLLLFWQMAERWGTRRGGGVHMPIRLTHQMLADLVGARRPSVSTALGRLRDAGSLENDPNGGWLLLGEAPGPHHPPLPHQDAEQPRR
jgi:CRP/FNR family transcriptional regulator, cyclic AMP receptor protein